MSTCTVGCKLPNGLILESGYTFANGSPVKLPNYKRVTLNGANSTRPAGVLVAVKQFEPGITENVDEEFFDAWMKSHAELSVVKNGLIWKMPRRSEALARAKDETQKPIGLEPIDPGKPLERRGGMFAGIEKRTKDDE